MEKQRKERSREKEVRNSYILDTEIIIVEKRIIAVEKRIIVVEKKIIIVEKKIIVVKEKIQVIKERLKWEYNIKRFSLKAAFCVKFKS